MSETGETTVATDGDSAEGAAVCAFIELVSERGVAWAADMLVSALEVERDGCETDEDADKWSPLVDAARDLKFRIERRVRNQARNQKRFGGEV